ncbi:MAG: trehalose-phosphatase [Acetobacter papayae]|uniref:trehalose-phosphatase n=1 Tax=Acetobacter papayae TaxID=1076592 RepID=UPI0039ECC048
MLGFHGAQSARFPIPPLSQAAFLLNFDGTLVEDTAPGDPVVLPPGLVDMLRRLRAACGDALAIVSSRTVEQLDEFLGDVPFAVGGEGGIALRHRPGGPIERTALPELPKVWLVQARDLVGTLPGVRLEHTEGGFILHYRAAPEAAQTLHAAAAAWVRESAGAYLLVAGRMAWEIRPAGVDKGYAVSLLMQRPPFLGRKPVVIGNDTSDESAMAVAKAAGGAGFRIPVDFPTPAVLRTWLAGLTA